jgi:ClpP class serine protease
MRKATYSPRGLLALEPSALGLEFEIPEPRDLQSGNVAVVSVVGPLVHHEHPVFPSYDGVKARVAAALASPAKCVLLSIDSPGGDLAGCLDCPTELRAMAEATGKPIYAYVDACTTSAAYALAMAASKIFIPTAGVVGSIGVISTLIDTTVADAAQGVRVTLVTSGARKADGNPHVVKSDATIAVEQSKVNAFAGKFFDLVSSVRGIPVEQIRGYEAGLFIGEQAIAAGLADQIATFDQVLALLSSASAELQPAAVAATQAGDEPQGDQMEEALKALRALADDESKPEEMRAKARKAIAAIETEEPKEEEAKAESEEPVKEEEPKEEKEEEKAQAVAVPSIAAVVAASQAEFEKQQLIAARADLPVETRLALSKAPLENVRAVLKTLPKLAAGPVSGARAAAEVNTVITAPVAPESNELAALDRAMGLTRETVSVKREAHRTIFPALAVKGSDK